MDTETASREILSVRQRLAEIQARRSELAPDDFVAKADLIDEEHELQARLANLQAEFVGESEEGIKPEDLTDLNTIVPPVV